MKRTALFLVCMLLMQILFSITAQAASLPIQQTVDGTISQVSYNQVNGQDEIRISGTKLVVKSHFILGTDANNAYYRLIVDISGATAKAGSMAVGLGFTVQVRYGQLDKTTARVVIDLKDKQTYTVSEFDGGVVVRVGKVTVVPVPTQKPVTPTVAPTTPTVTAKPTPIPTTKPSNLPTATPIPALATPVPTTIPISNTTIQSGSKNGLMSLSLLGNTSILKIDGFDIPTLKAQGKATITYREREKILQISLAGLDDRIQNGILSGNSIVYGVLISKNVSQNSINIRVSGKQALNWTMEKSGTATVFRFTTGATTPTSASTPTPVINPVKPTPIITPSPTVSPTAPTNNTSDGRTDTAQTATQLPTVSNLWTGDNTNIVARIRGEGIVQRYQLALAEIILDDDMSRGTFSFMFPLAVTNFGNGSVEINNALVTSITAFTTDPSTFLLINKQDKTMQFKIEEDVNGNELRIVKSTAETINIPANGKALVVLDPGHGGSDPGAVFGGIYESTLNLDVALRAEAILKQKGVNILLTRRTNTFVGLEERAEFANANRAAVFVSFHHNSMPQPTTRGTMTIYYPSSVNGRNYAQMLQDSFLQIAGTANIGLKDNGNLIVIKTTKMPAVLVEGACMSNLDDLALLRTEAFLQKEAEALANGILKILASMQ